jgi:sulfite exporter TauE/SafE
VISTAAGVFVASLVGSVHCAGMCGGFVCFYAGSAKGNEPAALRAHAMYNVGRLASYLLLGAVAGLVGAGVSRAGALVGVSRAATLLAGALMVGWALSTIAAQRGLSIGSPRAPLAWQRALGRVLHSVREQPIAVRAGLTGLFTTLLPCGWLYVFVATAGGTGSVTSAMATMALFWLGTVPALVAVGIGAQTLLAPFRRRLPMFSAAVVLVMGLLSMSGHLMPATSPDAHAGHAKTSQSSSATDALSAAAPQTDERTHVH